MHLDKYDHEEVEETGTPNTRVPFALQNHVVNPSSW